MKGAPPPELLAMGCEKADGQKHGPFRTWHKNAQLSESGAYVDGKLDGQFTAWNDRGQKVREGRYAKGEFDGHWTRWHEQGEKSDEGNWAGGKPTGNWTFWHPNGKKKANGDFGPEGEMGSWTFWTETGDLRESGDFAEGEKVCEWTERDAKSGEQTKRWEKRNANCPEGTAQAGGSTVRRWALGVFEGGGLAAIQPSQGFSYTWAGAWTPRLIWENSGFRILGRVGAIPYRISTGSIGFVIEYGAGVGLRLPFGATRPIHIEAVALNETWLGITLFAIKGRVSGIWMFQQPLLRFIDRAFTAYSMTFSGSNTVHTGMIGIGATFF